MTDLPLLLLLLIPQEPPKPEPEGPRLTSKDGRFGDGKVHPPVRDLQFKVLQRVIDNTKDDDPDRPDFMFRMAELYALQAAYFESKVRHADGLLLEAGKKKDAEASAKLAEERRVAEVERKACADSAVKQYRAVAEGPPYRKYKKMDQVLYSLVYLLADSRNEIQAWEFFWRLFKEHLESSFLPDAYLSMADVYFESKDLENAARFYEKVVDLGARRIEGYALYKKGWVHYRLMDDASAIDSFGSVLRWAKDPSRKARDGDAVIASEARKDLVMVFSRSGTPGQALDLFRKHGGDDALPMMRQLADVYAARGKPELAEAVRKLAEESKK